MAYEHLLKYTNDQGKMKTLAEWCATREGEFMLRDLVADGFNRQQGGQYLARLMKRGCIERTVRVRVPFQRRHWRTGEMQIVEVPTWRYRWVGE